MMFRHFILLARKAELLAVGLVLFCAAGQVAAQEVACGEGFSPSCDFELRQIEVPEVLPVFHLQSRISQGKLPAGELRLQLVVIKVLRGTTSVCQETISDVVIHESVINLEIGRNMSCDLSQLIAENPNLAFQVCLGGAQNCLKPIELASTPYAIKANYAVTAQRSQSANTAALSNYAQRASADRDLSLRRKISIGYFDFAAPSEGLAGEVYPDSEYSDLVDGGFIQWAPVRVSQARDLHISGKDQSSDRLVRLGALVFDSSRTVAAGDLVVRPQTGGDGLVLVRGNAELSGDSTVSGNLDVGGDVDVPSGRLHVASGSLAIGAGLDVSGRLKVESGGVDISGLTAIGGELRGLGDVEILASVAIGGNASINEQLEVGGYSSAGAFSAGDVATLKGDVAVSRDAAVGGLLTAGSLVVGGGVDVALGAGIDGDLHVAGPVTFEGPVRFQNGSSGHDLKYLQAAGEQRDLGFAGLWTLGFGAYVDGHFDLSGNHLKNLKFQMAASEPAPCSADNLGFVYLDTASSRVRICAASGYRDYGDNLAVGFNQRICGDGAIVDDEICDDGNFVAGDGCGPDCAVEAGWACNPGSPTTCGAAACGDGFRVGEEPCDDGNVWDSDGCNSQCQVEFGWSCGDGSPSVCADGGCGDGLIIGDEQCDDANTFSGDGCSFDCIWEYEFDCVDDDYFALPETQCVPMGCGNGYHRYWEEGCEDGNVESGDGCSPECLLENGWDCIWDAPNLTDCQPGPCGDGFRVAFEACDDGNWDSGDGCDPGCQIEPGWECNDADPSQCEQVIQTNEGGGSVAFFGNDQMLDTGDLGALNGVNTYSIQAWVRFDDFSQWSTVYASRTSDSNRSALLQIYDSSGRAMVSSGGGYCSTNEPVFQRHTWHHTVVVFDGRAPGGSRLALYVDGEQVDFRSHSRCFDVGNTSSTQGSRFVIGAEYSSTVTPDWGSSAVVEFEGWVSQVAIWEESFWPEAVRSLYNGGTAFDVRESAGEYGAWSLRHYWPLSETGGDFATDVHGGFGGRLLNGASFSPDGPLYADEPTQRRSLYFDGGEDVVDFGPLPVLENAIEYTISAWARFDSLEWADTLFAKRLSDGDRAVVLQLYGNDNGFNSRMAVGVNNGYCRTSGYPVERGRWHHFVLTYRSEPFAGASALDLYIDGDQQDLVECDEAIPSQTPGTPSRFTVGAEHNQLEPVFPVTPVVVPMHGFVGEVAIWDRYFWNDVARDFFHLSGGAVMSEVGAYSREYVEALRHFWPMDDGEFDSVTDQIGGVNGFLRGPDWSDDVPEVWR